MDLKWFSLWFECFALSEGELASIKPTMSQQNIIAFANKYKNQTEGELRRGFEEVAVIAASLKKAGPGERAARKKIRRRVHCPICLSKKKFVDTFRLGCGHEFCKACLRKSLGLYKTCPYCRQKIESVEGDNFYSLGCFDGIKGIFVTSKGAKKSNGTIQNPILC